MIINNKLDSPALGFFFFFFFLPIVKLKFINLPSIKTYFFISFYYLLLLLHYILFLLLLLLLLLLFLTKQAHLPGRNWMSTATSLYLDLTR